MLQEKLGAGLAPLELPIGEESAFCGIADLLTDTAIRYDNGSARSGRSPTIFADLEHQVREQLVEGIVVGDDALMERYLEGETPTSDELEETLATGIADGLVFPVVCGSAITGVGIDRLATLLSEIAPAPGRNPVVVKAGDTTREVALDPVGQPLAWVFKTISDPYVGHISLLQGDLGDDPARHRPHQSAHATPTRSCTSCRFCAARSQSQSTEAQAGDIVAVPKLGDTATGDTLAPKGTPVIVPRSRSRTSGAFDRDQTVVQG